MAPKKEKGQKMSLGDFMGNDTYGGSWADEVDDMMGHGTQLPPLSQNRSTYERGGYASIRDNLPQKLPDRPPFTAHLGNLSYDATDETVTEFFEGCNIVSVRIIEDREQQRPKGFAYAEFADLEGLKEALTRDGISFQGRTIRIKVADPPRDRDGGRGGESTRDFSDWTRKGPLADLPSRGGDRRGPSDFGERRPPREAPVDDGKVRDFGNWERKGPLSPLPQPERSASREGSRPRQAAEGRSESYRGDRRASPAAWGEGRPEGSRPPRREFSDARPERIPSAAEKDSQWRTSMRPDTANKSPSASRDGSEAPSSPAGPAPAPASRPKLNLSKRTVSEAPEVISPAPPSADPRNNPFGAARPIDTAAREREIEEKRQQAIREKKEADEKAKEQKRLEKEAAAAKEASAVKEASAAKEASAKAAAEEEKLSVSGTSSIPIADEVAVATPADELLTAPLDDPHSVTAPGPRMSMRPREGREPREPREPREARDPKSRANESGNWRSASGEHRGGRGGGYQTGSRGRGGGPPRGPRNENARPPRANGSSSAPTQQEEGQQAAGESDAPAVEDDGWTTVPKGRRGGGNRASMAA